MEREGLVGNKSLVLADLRKRTVEQLTSETESVVAFDVRDRGHYVYAVSDPANQNSQQTERSAPAIVETGRTLNELLFPDNPVARDLSPRNNYLWAVVDGKRFEVKGGSGPIIASGWNSSLALSPDGGSLVMRLPVSDIPTSWQTLYPPPYAASCHRLQAIGEPVVQYVQVDLRSGLVQSLTNAPTSDYGDWWAYGGPSWSNDGEAILLPGTFFKSKDNSPSRPCVAVVDLSFHTNTCVEMLKRHTETGLEADYHTVQSARFVTGDKRRVLVTFLNHSDASAGATEYSYAADGTWQVIKRIKGMGEEGPNGLEVAVNKASMSLHSWLRQTNRTSRVIWDANPQLKNIELGQASIYTWKDKEGREWKGGLYRPVNYNPGQPDPW